METTLRKKFTEHLIKNKEYPANSFLTDVHIVDNTGKNSVNKIFSDLAILDIVNNNYLALVEFKDSISKVTENDIFLHGQYLKVINDPFLNFYFVTSTTNNEFEIHSLNNGKLTNVDKDDFPDYETLKSKILADKQKQIISEVEFKNEDFKKRKSILYTTLIATLISLISGLIVSRFLITDNSFVDYDQSKIEQIRSALDSLIISKNEVKIDTTNRDKEEILKQVRFLNERIATIENLVKQDPKSLLEIQSWNNSLSKVNDNIETNKKLYELKVDNLQDKLNNYTTIVITLLVTIIGSLTAFSISTFKK
jgi:hypothetical protein